MQKREAKNELLAEEKDNNTQATRFQIRTSGQTHGYRKSSSFSNTRIKTEYSQIKETERLRINE